VDEGDDLRVGIGVERGFDFSGIDRSAPIVEDHDRRAAAAFDVFLHTPAEHAVLADNDFVTGFDEIDEATLHARGTGRGHGKGHLVLGLKGVLKEGLHFVHHADELGVEVADGGARHGP
jgi:hypothetical protein